jgi:hypothetical protein
VAVLQNHPTLLVRILPPSKQCPQGRSRLAYAGFAPSLRSLYSCNSRVAISMLSNLTSSTNNNKIRFSTCTVTSKILYFIPLQINSTQIFLCFDIAHVRMIVSLQCGLAVQWRRLYLELHPRTTNTLKNLHRLTFFSGQSWTISPLLVGRRSSAGLVKRFLGQKTTKRLQTWNHHAA